MSGGQSYPSLHSPTGSTPSSNYPPYSPTQRQRPYYGNDPYPPPQTPPPYSGHPPVAQSPHFTASQPSMNSSLPPLNGSTPRPAESSPQYHNPASSPGYSRSYATQYAPSSGQPYLTTPSSHAHPSILQEPPISPTRERHNVSILNGDNGDTFGAKSSIAPTSRPVSQDKPARASDPMSFANILSEPAAPRPTPKTSPPRPEVLPKPPQSVEQFLPEPLKDEPSTSDQLKMDMAQPKPAPAKSLPSVPVSPNTLEKMDAVSHINGDLPLESLERRSLTDKELNKVSKVLETLEAEESNDVDLPEFAEHFKIYEQRREKRTLDNENNEMGKRKRRRTDFLETMRASFVAKAAVGNERFRTAFEAAAQEAVHNKEIHDEKERKKDMQRKRRREQTIRNERQKMEEAEAKAQRAEDSAEKERLQREAEKHGKKIKTTERALKRGNAPQEISEVTPLAPNLEGGTTSTFQIAATESPEPPRSKRKTGASSRPKKSKEQKQQEKDKAEAAFAAMDKDEPVRIAPKEEPRKDVAKKEGKSSRSKESKEISPPSTVSAYDSKGYMQIYEQIWRDMARKDIPKVTRIKAVSLSTRQENLRKTAQLASKQAKKWQERTNKSMKDTQARAKRTMREMMSFWKRNEREERDLRRLAEKKEIEDAKKAEAEREANRQKRKLNFLISQTELYSHFIGRKIKTDEVERATDDPDVAASDERIQTGKEDAHTINLPSSISSANRKVTNIEDLDFDAEDETALQEAAMANAQNAIQEAQDKARAFNEAENKMAAFDEGELNFQNPTSFGDVQVSQPKMLQAQLKEYQLKGLNWLVNLYEQGINGILADEMGLGKTVQSISVMGYLAENHNIWGPFLVIAPSSTLHNWQQEIAKFVPAVKVLPYWGNAKDRKILRKFWDRKHITYTKESEFHVLVTSYQLVVQDAQYFQKVRWQYMILDEAQAIKSSSSSRWKVLLGFHCRNRLLLTGTPIQNNMQELWALLHFIMPTLFDSHDEFSDWFSKDIESHAQSNTKLNQDQLKRLHMILKPFMLRRVKAHVQKELGDKVEKDVFCDLTYRQRAYYSNLRSRISIMDLIEKVTLGDDQDTANLMNLVMQFRKVCNHPDLFERADTTSPFAFTHFAETASFVREGQNVQVGYSVRNAIEYDLPRVLCDYTGRLDVPGPTNARAGFEQKHIRNDLSIWTPSNVISATRERGTFSFSRFVDSSVSEICRAGRVGLFERALGLKADTFAPRLPGISRLDHDTTNGLEPLHALFDVVARKPALTLSDRESPLYDLCNVSRQIMEQEGLGLLEPATRPGASAPPIQISCSDQNSLNERQNTMFNVTVRKALYPLPVQVEETLLSQDVDPTMYPMANLLPAPSNQKSRYTNISVPSMRRFVTDSGKLAKLDWLLRELKNGGHRVLLYFQMTRMIDLMEEYLTYRNYKYCRLDGSTKLEDRRDTVHDFQTRPEIFIFLLSTRAGGLGINLTSADTVIFYDSDWNPTIDSQAMDRAHRLGQTKQVTVYRMITRGTIEERIRKRALQKEEVQRVVISGGAAGGVDFNTRIRENRTKDIAMWLADDDQAALIEQKEREAAERPPEEDTKGKRSKKAIAAAAVKRKRGEMSMDDFYHEGEGHFEDQSAKASGAATPVETSDPGAKRGPRGGKGISKKAKTREQRLQMIDAEGDMGLG